jgi:hypothetical protein
MPAPAPPLRPIERPRGARVLSAILAAVALVLVLALVWTVGQLRGREAAHREAVAELAARAAEAEARRVQIEAERAEIEAQRAQIAARLEAAERELAAVRAASAKQSEEVAAATAARLEQLEQDLAAARARIEMLARGIQRRDADIEHLEAAVQESRTLHELLATPGAQLLRLEPSPPFRAPRGHVLWNPARPVLMLYAFGLPRLPEGVSYRLRLVTEGEGGAIQPVLSPDRAGEILLPVRLDDTPARLRAVEIVRDPPGEAVLSGRLAPPAS